MKTSISFQPELLIPAGSFEKLRAASLYGADAVYLSGQKFGLRTASENFTLDELAEGVRFAHDHGVKTYLVLNGFLHDRDLTELPDFVKYIASLQVDGVIASDLGVIRTVKKNSSLPVHLSTQASCLNLEAGKLWKDAGVKRLILGREVGIRDAGKIKRETGLEVELFIHGSMCMAYSGNCTISNFTQGRDSNRGGCAQSCRFEYDLNFTDGSVKEGTFFLSSKDLMGLRLIPEFCEEEIDSLKIEGRMRSPLYAALSAKIYREAMDSFQADPSGFEGKVRELECELEKLPHREYASGSLEHRAGADTVFSKERRGIHREEYLFLGSILKVKPQEWVLLEVRSQFSRNDSAEWMLFEAGAHKTGIDFLQSSLGEPIEVAKTATMVRLPWFEGAEVGQLLRKTVLS